MEAVGLYLSIVMCFVLAYCYVGMLMTLYLWDATPIRGRKRITHRNLIYIQHVGFFVTVAITVVPCIILYLMVATRVSAVCMNQGINCPVSTVLRNNIYFSFYSTKYLHSFNPSSFVNFSITKFTFVNFYRRAFYFNFHRFNVDTSRKKIVPSPKLY